MKSSRTSLAVLLGGAGGAINAFLVFAGVPVSLTNQYLTFRWHIVPAGFFHGALLVWAALMAYSFFGSRKGLGKWLGLLFAGYAAGWISGIPLTISLQNKFTLSFLWWPLEQRGIEIFTTPFFQFGLVSAIYYLELSILELGEKKNPFTQVFLGVVAGVFGSLYWWQSLGPWKLSLLHGSIWGLGAGYGFYKQNSGKGKAKRE